MKQIIDGKTTDELIAELTRQNKELKREVEDLRAYCKGVSINIQKMLQ